MQTQKTSARQPMVQAGRLHHSGGLAHAPVNTRGSRPILSRQAHTPDRRGAAGRSGRYAVAAGRPAAHRGAGTTRRDRQSRRGERQHCVRDDRARRTGWLHDHRGGRGYRDQSQPLPRRGIRSGQGLRGDHAGDCGAQYSGRASGRRRGIGAGIVQYCADCHPAGQGGPHQGARDHQRQTGRSSSGKPISNSKQAGKYREKQ